MIKEFENIDKRIATLKKTKLDFLNFCKENLEYVIDNNVKDISDFYGCGMSFIYGFLKKLGLKSFREFRLYLQLKYFKNNDEISKWNENLSETISETSEYNEALFVQQQFKIDELLQKIFKEKKQVFFCGLGYSALASYDLFALKFLLPELKWHFVKESRNEYNFNELKYDLEDAVFVVFSLSGRSKNNVSFLEKIKEKHKNIMTFLITGNNDYNNLNIDTVIITANAMKSNDVYTRGVIISPVYDFILFNNYIKTRALHLYKDIFFASDKFNEEFLWWEKPKKIKKMSF